MARLIPMFLALVAALLGGCTFYSEPTFELVAAQEIERTPEATVLRFTLLATNGNEEALPLRRTKYTLRLDGREVFRGQRSAFATIPAYGTQPVVLPAVIRAEDFDLSRLDSGELRFGLSGSVEYQTPGQFAEVLFDTGVRRPKASIGIRGMLDLEP